MARAVSISQFRGAASNIRKAGRRLIAVAMLFIILGIFAIAEPEIARFGLPTLLGWLLVFAGVGHLSLVSEGSRGTWQLILGAIYVIGGVFPVTHPLLGLDAITLLLSIVIFVEGALDLTAYFATRNESGSVWLLVNGLITLMLGGLISIHLPWNSTGAIGAMLGLNLLTTGISRLMLGITARSPATRVAG
jgi:uncharacterized membrane protein HdeD (DUF308 family)